jgi:hypothetical protein
MHTNSTRTGEEPGQTGDQGPLRFHLNDVFVSSCLCNDVAALKSVLASVSRYTLSQTVPHLVKLFLDPDELSNRAPITVLLAELVAAARDSMTKSSEDPELDVPLMPFKDEVLGVFIVGLQATSCQPALAGLTAMVTTPALLADEELGFIVHNIDDILQANPDDGDDARFVVNFLVSKRHSPFVCIVATTHCTYFPAYQP